MTNIIYAGGPCTCRPGRYVRYFVPAVPGCEATVFCRDVEAGKEGKAQHPPPAGAMLAMRVPEINSSPRYS